MSDILPIVRHFKIINQNLNKTAHICIDGDFITFGREKYNINSLSFSDGRPDSLVFNNKKVLFLELKVDQEDDTESKEDPKWKKFFEGARQILDFVIFLRDNGFEIESYNSDIYAVVCFRFEPNFSIISNGNTQRNNERFKISQKLGFRLLAHNHNDVFEL